MKIAINLLAACAALTALSHAPQALAADYKDRTIKVSHVVPKDHPFQVGIDKYAQLLAEKTGGLMNFKGLKIRTIQNAVFVDVFNTLGANATPMPFTEVYAALESRAIDGQETPYSNIHGNRFYEVQKYVSTTGHIYGGSVILMSKKYWDTLTGDEQKLLQESCWEARDHERRYSRENDPKLLAELKTKGIQHHDVTPAERARMRAALQPVYDKYAKTLGEDVVKQTLAELERVRGQGK